MSGPIRHIVMWRLRGETPEERSAARVKVKTLFEGLKGRIDGNLAIVDKRLATRSFMLGERPTIADISLAGYLYYPAEEFGFDIPGTHPSIAKWLDRLKALPGWKHPYELMPGYPMT